MNCPNAVDTSGRPVHASSRVPSTLQAVILASNRGHVVNTPPPRQVAFKTFRGWLGRTFSSDSTKRKPCNEIVLSESITSKIIPSEQIDSKAVLSEPVALNVVNNPKKKKVSLRNSLKLQQRPLFLTIRPSGPFFLLTKWTTRTPSLSPQQYMDAMIRSRGYSVVTCATLKSAYYNKPTPLQEASYGLHVIALVKCGDAEGLRKALASGLSSNPANNHGESLLHMICRRGDTGLLSVMLELGCDIQVTDDYCRTQLHDACWASEPAFELVDKLLERDIRLFYMTDCRGALPLSYVRKEHWSQWLQYLESKKEVYWPRRCDDEKVPKWTLQLPNTRPVPDPEQALTLELAYMVANGKMTPAEARFLNSDIVDDGSTNFEISEYDDHTDIMCVSDDECSQMSGVKNELVECFQYTQLMSRPVAYPSKNSLVQL